MIARKATRRDNDVVWWILEPTIRAGETYPLPTDLRKQDALDYWYGVPHEVFVCENDRAVLGTYFLAPNHRGGGSHIANCGYMVFEKARG